MAGRPKVINRCKMNCKFQGYEEIDDTITYYCYKYHINLGITNSKCEECINASIKDSRGKAV